MENTKPSLSVVKNFRRIYEMAAEKGRGDALFGAGTMERAADALKGGAIAGAGDGAAFYFEFPFTGPPRMDLMVSYECADLPPSLAFEDGYDGSLREPLHITDSNSLRSQESVIGDGYGFRPFFEACAADPNLETHFCGFSFDLSDITCSYERSELEHVICRGARSAPSYMADKENEAVPGVYLLPSFESANVDYVPKMLARLGGGERVPGVMAAFAATPDAWQPYYAGYMPGRRGAPTRLGFIVPNATEKRYIEKPERLAEDVAAFSGITLSAGGREALDFLVGSGAVWDLQFDLLPDGTFADDLGVTLGLGFNQADVRSSAGFLETGRAGEVMEKIEAMGLADSRWRLMDKACYGVQRFVRGVGGKFLRVGDMVKLNAVKVRFRRGEAHLAKGYLLARSRIL